MTVGCRNLSVNVNPRFIKGLQSLNEVKMVTESQREFRDVSNTIRDLTTWVAVQTDQAIISHTLILLNSLKRNASLAQIAENTAHWEAAVRAGR